MSELEVLVDGDIKWPDVVRELRKFGEEHDVVAIAQKAHMRCVIRGDPDDVSAAAAAFRSLVSKHCAAGDGNASELQQVTKSVSAPEPELVLQCKLPRALAQSLPGDFRNELEKISCATLNVALNVVKLQGILSEVTRSKRVLQDLVLDHCPEEDELSEEEDREEKTEGVLCQHGNTQTEELKRSDVMASVEERTHYINGREIIVGDLKHVALHVEPNLGAGIDLEWRNQGYLVLAVETEPGQDFAPGDVITKISGAALFGLDEDSIAEVFGDNFQDGADLLVLTPHGCAAPNSPSHWSQMVADPASLQWRPGQVPAPRAPSHRNRRVELQAPLDWQPGQVPKPSCTPQSLVPWSDALPDLLQKAEVGEHEEFWPLERVTSRSTYYSILSQNVRAEMLASIADARGTRLWGTGAGSSRGKWLKIEGKSLQLQDHLVSLGGRLYIIDRCSKKVKTDADVLKESASEEIDNEIQTDVMYVQGRAANSSLLQHAARKDERIKMTALCFLGDYKARLDSCWNVSKGVDKVDTELERMVLFPGRPVQGTWQDLALTGSLHLNQLQQRAVEALSKRVECVHGPPGTGKSKTIVDILRTRLPCDQRALVTCVTNRAVDSVSLKLAQVDFPFIVLGSNAAETASKFTLDALVHRSSEVHEAPGHLQGAARLKAQSRLLQECRAVLCTIGSSARVARLQKEQEWSPLFVGLLDEAAATPETYVPLLLRLGIENLVLVGDHKQLAPLVVGCSDALVVRSLMERCLDHGVVAHPLRVQYRMFSKLCALVSKLSYDEKLVSANEVCGSIRWLDVPGPEQSVGSSFVNIAQAAACLEVIEGLVGEVLVICMYRPMAKVMQILVDEIDEHQVRVGTVDAAQGAESDHVVLLSVRSNPRHQIGFCDNLRRLNVALSRAKLSLTIIGNAETMHGELWKQVQGASDMQPTRVSQKSVHFSAAASAVASM